MNIKQLTLQNIRSYKNQTVEFPNGTILIHGENGAGKTSLLMGIFGGLFLSKIRSVGTNSFTLDDLVRRGTDKGTVELIFELDGTPFTVTWDLYTTSTPNSATLESPTLSDPITGITDVREEIIDRLGMDEDDFSSSVYVKQGEIDRLIEADDRAELIDSLLGLDKLDQYIKRMKLARRGANRVKRANENSRENYEADLADFERSEPEYEAQIEELTTEISTLESDIDEVEAFISDLKEHRTSIEGDIETYEDLKERKADKETQIEEAKSKREAQQEDIDESEATIEDARGEISDVEAEIVQLGEEVDYDLSTEASTQEAKDAAQEAYTDATTERTRCDAALENAKADRERLTDALSEATAERDSLEEDHDSREAALEDAKAQLTEAESELETRQSKRNEAVTEFLLSVDDPDAITDDHQESIEERVAELESEREELSVTKRGVTAERSHATEQLTDAKDTLDTAKAERSEATDELNEQSDRIAALESDLAEANSEFERQVTELSAQAEAFEFEVTAENLTDLRDTTLPDRVERLNNDLNDVDQTIAKHRRDREQAESELAEIRALAKEDTCPKCGQSVDEAHIEEEVSELEAEIEAATEALDSAQATKDDLQSRKADLETLREGLLDTITFQEETLAELQTNLASLKEAAEDTQDRIDELDEAIADHEATISETETEISELDDRIAQLDTDIETIANSISTGENILGLFGEVADQRAAVSDAQEEIAAIEDEIAAIEDDIEDKENEIEDLETKIEDKESEIEEQEAALMDAEEQVTEAKRVRDIVHQAVDAYDRVSELQTTIDQEQQTIKHCRERIEDLNGQIRRLEDELADIEAQLGAEDIESLQEDLDRVTNKIQERAETLEEYEDTLQATRTERTGLEKDLANLRDTKAQIEAYERKEQWADEVHSELDTIISIYQHTKSELRQQYLAYITEYTNDIFQEIYKNSSYQQVLIEETDDDAEYHIRLLREDNTTEDPSNASGGERAIVNLALRAGIYKLIAEMHGGDRGQLPPFILDEPTTFLDEGHVGQLEQMLDRITDWDVPQVLVVSHDERLIHGADHEIHVTIDPATNTSQLTMRTAGERDVALDSDGEAEPEPELRTD